jgi:LmbE family N-acetylglucosaminyl deacetylase
VSGHPRDRFTADCVRFIDQLNAGMARLPIRFFGTEENRDAIRLAVSKIVKEFGPDLIFSPSIHETMQDHRALGEEVVRVIRGRAMVLGYEVPKHNRFFQPNVFVELSDADVAAKIRALNCFSEFTTSYYFEADAIKSLARVRGLDAGFFGLCEAFELYRLMD